MTNIAKFDVIFISYQEPNKEDNWANLLRICPWAERVDNIEGIDQAHKEAANLATTDHFITVDGDNVVYPDFFNEEINTDKFNEFTTVSWCGRNNVNNLVTGNGGLKLWSKKFVEKMAYHKDGVNFCWDRDYHTINEVWSDTIINSTPTQAFRAGFREGVKLTMNKEDPISLIGNDKVKVTPIFNLINLLGPTNIQRLGIWCSIGNDVVNGRYVILGARKAVVMALWDEYFDFTKINDYTYIDSLMPNEENFQRQSDEYLGEIQALAIPITNFNKEQSQVAKNLTQPSKTRRQNEWK